MEATYTNKPATAIPGNLIVNYLPPSVTEEGLRELFASFGEIESCKLMINKQTGESLGYGFVKYAHPESGASTNAINAMNGKAMENKRLKVSYARPSANTGLPMQQFNQQQQMMIEMDTNNTNVYICHLAPHITKQALDKIFSQYGTIEDSRIIIDPATNQSKGVGFVRYSSPKMAQSAIENLNGTLLPATTTPIIVKLAESQQEKLNRKRLLQVQTMPPMYHGSKLRYSPYGQQALFQQPMMTPTVPPPYSMSPSHSPSSPSDSQSKRMSGFSLFVYNLPPDMDEGMLYQWFSPYGAISSARVIRNLATGTCKGYGFVNFVKFEDAQMAVASLNGCPIGNKTLQVSFKVE